MFLGLFLNMELKYMFVFDLEIQHWLYGAVSSAAQDLL